MIPLVRGLYLAERVETAPTSNLTLIERFRTPLLPGGSGEVRPFAVVAYLANGVGRYRFTVRVTRLDTMGEVYSAGGELVLPDRLQELRFVFRCGRCVFPGPGAFEVALWVGEELLAQTPFAVRRVSGG